MIVKTTFLSITELVIFNVLMPISFAIYAFILPQNIETLLWTICVALYVLSLEMICIVLGLQMNQKYYRKCCGKCDDALLEYSMNRTEAKVQERRSTVLEIANMEELRRLQEIQDSDVPPLGVPPTPDDVNAIDSEAPLRQGQT